MATKEHPVDELRRKSLAVKVLAQGIVLYSDVLGLSPLADQYDAAMDDWGKWVGRYPDLAEQVREEHKRLREQVG